MKKTEMKRLLSAVSLLDATGLLFQKFLHEHDILLVTVNPFTVNRSKELDDNSPEKSDLKDPKQLLYL